MCRCDSQTDLRGLVLLASFANESAVKVRGSINYTMKSKFLQGRWLMESSVIAYGGEGDGGDNCTCDAVIPGPEDILSRGVHLFLTWSRLVRVRM